MKVGILTFHATTNYGATLQTYALCKVIKERGYDVEIIDYQPDQLSKTYFKHLYQNRYFAINAIKSWNMKNFLYSQVKLSAKRYRTSTEMKVLNNEYDIVICGSDEIWNINSQATGFDPAFFLDFIFEANIRKLSYAASFGSTTELGQNKGRIYELLEKFHAISVRDKNSLMLVQGRGNLQAQKVVDPTLLADYRELVSIPKVKKNYILVYGGLTQEERSYIKKVGEAEGLDIIAVGYPCRTARVNRLEIGPKEWVSYFSKASYIFTNFYHGVLFSLIFRKPFTVFDRSDKSVKIRDILSDIGLEDRILTKDCMSNINQKLSLKLDFDELKLSRMIQDSKTYLYRNLEQKM